jgi:hypothetical protein
MPYHRATLNAGNVVVNGGCADKGAQEPGLSNYANLTKCVHQVQMNGAWPEMCIAVATSSQTSGLAHLPTIEVYAMYHLFIIYYSHWPAIDLHTFCTQRGH